MMDDRRDAVVVAARLALAKWDDGAQNSLDDRLFGTRVLRKALAALDSPLPTNREILAEIERCAGGLTTDPASPRIWHFIVGARFALRLAADMVAEETDERWRKDTETALRARADELEAR